MNQSKPLPSPGQKPLWIIFSDLAYGGILRGHFMPSWNKCNGSDFELHPQNLFEEFGNFGEPDFRRSFRRQMSRLRDIVAANIGRTTVWSDTDLRFYRPVYPEVKFFLERGGADVWTSMDAATHCTGFQFFRASYRVVRFIEEWIDLTDSASWGELGAQESFNLMIAELKPRPWNFLSGHARVAPLDERFWNLGFAQLPVIWEAGMPVSEPPKGIGDT